MGREIKRVALDFDWPLGEVWEGFLNPHYKPCGGCEGEGRDIDRKWLDAVVQLLMNIGEAAERPQWGLGYLSRLGFRYAPTQPPTRKFAELTKGLAGREMGLLGHDSMDQYSALCKIIEAAGLDEKWGWCAVCGGDGIDPTHKEAYEAWTETEPPSGEGWQVWETVSEGSPISPVFETATELVEWLIGEGYSEHASRQFVEHQWAPSMIVSPTGIYTDIESWREDV